MLRHKILADLLRDPKIGLPYVLKQFGQVQPNRGIFLEQQLLEHSLVNCNHLLQMGSKEIHGMLASILSCADGPANFINQN